MIGVRPEFIEIAEEVEARLSQLNEKEAEVKARLSEIQSEKAKLNASCERINSIRSGDSEPIRFACPDCYIIHGIESEMASIPSEGGHADLFRCHKCDYELEIEI